MNLEAAQAIGDVGERAVSQALQRLAPRYGFRQLDNILVQVRSMTGQLDHVVIDSRGIVVLESKVRRNALIKGRDVEKSWTACYRSGNHSSFQNPIAQNREHENLLLQALNQPGSPLDPDYLESVVVFVDADITHLELKSSERTRVLDIEDLEQYFVERAAHVPLREPWDPAKVDVVTAALVSLDRSGDEATQRRHDQYRRRYTSAGSSAPYSSTRAAEQYLASRTRSHASNSPFRELGDMLVRAAIVFAVLGLLWLCAVSGVADFAIRGISAMVFPGAHASVSAASATAHTGATIEVAKRHLQEVAPEVASHAVEMDKPVVSQAGGLTTFTWRYIPVPTTNRAVVKTFSLVLGPDGSIRGMGAGK